VAVKKVPLTVILRTLSDGPEEAGKDAAGQRYERRLKMALREASMTSR
jgi:hypothetical protein